MILPPSIAQSSSNNEPASPPATSGFAASRSGLEAVARPPSILAGAEDGNLLLQPASTTPAAPSFSSSVPRYSKEAAAEASRALDALGTALDASLIKACASAVLDFMIAELELSVQQNGNGSMMNGHRSSAHEMNGGVVDGDAGEVEPGMRSLTMEDFQLLRLVGKGGYGKAFQVRCTLNEMVYAMKVVDKASIERYRSMDNIAIELQILRRHAEQRHPFILGLECAFQSSSKLHFVMEYVPGGMLFAHLR